MIFPLKAFIQFCSELNALSNDESSHVSNHFGLNDFFILISPIRGYMATYQSKTNIWSITLKLLGATTNRDPYDCWNFQGKTALLSSNQVYTLFLKWINVSAPQHLLSTSAPARHLSTYSAPLGTSAPSQHHSANLVLGTCTSPLDFHK